jgi:DNA gyrase subunit A
MGKRSAVEDYRPQHRGGKGLINVRITPKTGAVIAIKEVTDEDELLLVTRNGVINRQPAREIRVIGRNTQGVRLIALDKGDELMDLARLPEETADDVAAGEAVEELEDEALAVEASDDGATSADD